MLVSLGTLDLSSPTPWLLASSDCCFWNPPTLPDDLWMVIAMVTDLFLKLSANSAGSLWAYRYRAVRIFARVGGEGVSVGRSMFHGLPWTLFMVSSCLLIPHSTQCLPHLWGNKWEANEKQNGGFSVLGTTKLRCVPGRQILGELEASRGTGILLPSPQSLTPIPCQFPLNFFLWREKGTRLSWGQLSFPVIMVSYLACSLWASPTECRSSLSESLCAADRVRQR